MSKTKVAKDLVTFIEQNHEFTQTRVAASIGVSVSALNAHIQGTYKGDNARIERAIVNFLEAQRESGEETGRFKKDFDFVETKVYQDVLRSVNLAQYRGEIRPIVGLSGIGKTVALEHIKVDRGAAMILVRAYPGIRKTRVMRKLCQAAGFEVAGTYDDMFEELASRLDGTGRFIAIDEAEHLNVESIDAVRRLTDFTGCGAVLVGLPKFYNELSRRQADYAYIYNRTAMPMKLAKNSAEDLAKMASTMISASIPDKIYLNASAGIGRDLRIILLESLRVASENGISPEDTTAFTAIIDRIKKNLGRKVA